ncbi:MAG: hypothetical protein JNG89_11765 [Planctomycetaceae bacterium]|nr:hypothetical protein [Planctomycetaceae bacterium]
MSTVHTQVHDRSRLFVDRRLQGDIVKRILLHWLAFLTVGTAIGVTLRWFTHPTVPLSEQFGEMFAEFGPFLVALIALLPVFVLDTIKLTNRFAGPYVRFRRHIRDLVENRASGPIKFRDGDFWRETEDDLNSLLSEIARHRAAPAGADSSTRGDQ